MKTPIIFRKFKTGEVIALLVHEPGTTNPATCLNYMHIGQHGSGIASNEGTLPAKPEEYKSLLNELTNIGYKNIVIRHKPSYKDYLHRAGIIALIRASN